MDVFNLSEIKNVSFGSIIDSYSIMHDEIRKVFVTNEIIIEYKNGVEKISGQNGFLACRDTIFFVSSNSISDSSFVSYFESCFVSIGSELPSRIFKDAFPDQCESISVDTIVSTPSMLAKWTVQDILTLRPQESQVASDYHVDVSNAKTSINKYMRRTLPEGVAFPALATSPAVHTGKRPRDAREFREQILSNGAQAEFFVWSQIKSQYGSLADLSWWLTSAKRQFFPSDLTPIDDALGADFYIPRDFHQLFASKKGAPVYIEVKGTGRTKNVGEEVTFEISRNELKKAQEVIENPNQDEFVVAVVSGLAGMGRPKLECIVRDFTQLNLVPTRFIATVKPNNKTSDQESPSLTKSTWYT